MGKLNHHSLSMLYGVGFPFGHGLRITNLSSSDQGVKRIPVTLPGGEGGHK